MYYEKNNIKSKIFFLQRGCIFNIIFNNKQDIKYFLNGKNVAI